MANIQDHKNSNPEGFNGSPFGTLTVVPLGLEWSWLITIMIRIIEAEVSGEIV